MKKFKKLVPALCMLLVSVALLGTSTYAWFSMNKTVTASGLAVTAKSDFTFLVISRTEGETYPDKGDKNTKSVDLEAVKSLKPVAHDALTGVKASGELLSKKDAPDDNLLKYWYTNKSASAAESDASGDNKYVVEASKDDYLYHTDLYLNLVPGSVKAEKITPTVTLTVPALADGNADNRSVKAIRVLLVCDTKIGEVKYIELKFEADGKVNADTKVTTYTATTTDALIEELEYAAATADASGSEKHVAMFVYYDGADASIFTNKFANIGGGSLEVSFTIAP